MLVTTSKSRVLNGEAEPCIINSGTMCIQKQLTSKKACGLIVFFSVLCLEVQSQITQIHDLTPHSLTVATPDAASLGRYGLGSIGMYTGMPDVSIPIHELQFENLRIPIALSYSMNGLHPAEEASWVGLGWNLSASAAITRKVYGSDDFNPTLGRNYQLGWIYQPDLAVSPGTSPTIPSSVEYEFDNMTGPCGYPDTQPDLFTVNLFGKTFRFILINKAANGGVVGVKVLDDLTYKVEYEGLAGAGNFVIYDEHANRFMFTIKEQSRNVLQGCSNNMTTAWYVSSITSLSGNVMTFSYRSNLELTMSQIQTVDQSSWGIVQGEGVLNPPTQLANSFSQTTSSLVYLKSISFEGETVLFNTSTRTDLLKSTTDIIGGVNLNNPPRRLTSIIVKFDSVLQKTIQFYESYFNSQITTDVTKFQRLKLDSVDVAGKRYQFAYEQPNTLPEKTTKSVDYWGYYNGRANTKLYPSFYYQAVVQTGNPWCVIPGGDLTSQWYYGQRGMLTEITYPTRGKSSFVYEANVASVGINDFADVDRAHFDTTIVNTYNGMYSQTKQFDFSIDEPLNFYGSNPAVSGWAMVNLAITTGNRYPVQPIQSNHPQINSTAAEVINLANNAVIFSTIYKDYTDYCGQLPLCPRADTYFTGLLPPGNYRVKLFGTINSLDTELKLRIPYANITNGPTSINKVVGGGRVKRVVDYDEHGNQVASRSYRYVTESGMSSGGLMNLPVYAQKRKHWYSDGGQFSCLPGWGTPYVFYYVVSSSPSNSISQTAQGSFLGYSVVDEIFESNINPQISYSKRTFFTNSTPSGFPWAYVSHNVPFCFPPFVKSGDGHTGIIGIETRGFSVLNGLVLKEEFKDSGGAIVKKVENTYNILSQPGLGGLAILTGAYADEGATNHQIDAARVDYYYREKGLLSSSTTTEYSATGELSTSIAYTYNDRWLSSTQSSIDSKGSTVVTRDYYVHEYAGQANSLLSKPVKSETTVNGNLVFGNILTYNSAGLPDKQYKYESAALTPPSIHSPDILVPPNYFEKRSFIYANGKLRQVLDNSGVMSYLWGYNQHLIVGQVTGARWNEVFHTSFEGEEGGAEGTLGNKSKIGKFHKNDGYSKALSGLIAGKPYVLTYWKKTTGDWELQTLNVVPSGTTYTISVSTEFDVDDVRFFPKGAEMTTYTYKPLIGVETKSDPNNVVTKYSYDNFGRLTVIQDDKDNSVKHYKYHFRNGSN